MAGSTYTIKLNLEGEDKVLGDLAKMDQGLAAVSDAAKNLNFRAAAESAAKAADMIGELANGEGDATRQMSAFAKASAGAYAELQRQAALLQYTLSEGGKERLKELRALKEERAALGNSKEEKKKAQEIDKRIAELRKTVADLSDDELKAAVKENRLAREKLKIAQMQAKHYGAEQKSHKSMLSYAKDDLKAWRDRLGAVKNYIAALKTAEGRYKALKGAAKAVGKAGIAGAAAVGGMALGLGAAAVSSANRQVEAEREAARLRLPGTLDEKREMLGRLYVETGAGYGDIVDAVNRVRTAIKTTNPQLIEKAAVAELKFPGGAALFRQQTGGRAGALDFAKYAAVASAMQGATGATRAQIEASAGKIANMREKSFTNASQTELQAVYLGLQNSGAFDDQGELDRAFARFVRAQAQGKDGVFELAKKWDWGKGAQGTQNRTQARNAAGLIDWAGLQAAAGAKAGPEKTAAERTAQELRRIEEIKNQVLIKVLKGLEPFFNSIKPEDVEKFANNLADVINAVLPEMLSAVSFVASTIKKIYDWFADKGEQAERVATAAAESQGVSASGVNIGIARRRFADGGIASMPSLCGEAGPEAVIPLSHERAGRGAQIVQNLTQYFEMGQGETTARSLAGAMAGTAWGADGARRFARRMGRG